MTVMKRFIRHLTGLFNHYFDNTPPSQSPILNKEFTILVLLSCLIDKKIKKAIN